MYAQCPDCLTFFHLKPSHLKAANGQVRCSRCKHVFNALETLRDELTPEEIAAVQAARRREPKPDAPLLKDEYAGDLFEGLEYTRNAELGLGEPETVGGKGSGDSRRAERDAEERAELESAPGPVFEKAIVTGPLGARERPGFVDSSHGRKRHPLLLGLLNLILLLALLAQLVHWQRDRVLEHPLAGPWLAKVYAATGFDTSPPRDLAALKISRTEVSSHPDHPRALHLTALLENNAPDVQPWPEIRVDLQDRWGETVGARYFAAAEYLREPTSANAAMPARARFPVSLAILDPGNEAVGFQVEACFGSGNGDQRRHVCTSDIEQR